MAKLKTQLCEWLAIFERKRDLPTAAKLFCLAVILQWLGGAYQSEFGGHPDEPAHYVTGLMVRDYVATSLGKHPMVFAEDYYDHYPKVALGNWPPMFYAMQAAWTLPFGVSRVSVMLLMAVLSASLAWLIYRALRNEFGQRVAIGGAVLFLLLPLVQEHTALVMTEIPITLLVMLAALAFGRFLDREQPLDAALFGVFAALGILTKGSAMSLALAVPLAVLLTRRFHLFTKVAFWIPVPIVFILAGPWTFKFREQAKAGWEFPQPCWEFTSSALAYYPRKLVLAVGATLFLLAVIGIYFKVGSMRRREPGSGKWAMALGCLISVVLAHFVIPCGYEPRHLIPALPALMMFVVAGAEMLVGLVRTCGVSPLKSRVMVWGLAVAAFAGGTFQVYSKGNMGYAAVAAWAFDGRTDPGRDSRHKLLISSDATGEGIFIAEVAMREDRPRSTVRRASKMLASSSWSGAGYQAKFERDEDLFAALFKDGINFIVTDDSIPANKRMKHHDQLQRAIDANPGYCQLLRTFPMARGRQPQANAIRVYYCSPYIKL